MLKNENDALMGKCSVCKGVFGKAEILKHLESCTQNKESGRDKAFWLLVEGHSGVSAYWLVLEVSARAALEDVDSFLRNIWLECCGHMSAFRIGDKTYISGKPEEADEEDMSARVDKLFKTGLSFEYEYDFGSTTELTIKVVAEHSGLTGKKPVNLLARNEPPELKCSCGQKAVHVCCECMNNDPKQAFLCDDCLADHDCGEEMTLPVVNSPRIGTCGYTGEE